MLSYRAGTYCEVIENLSAMEKFIEDLRGELSAEKWQNLDLTDTISIVASILLVLQHTQFAMIQRQALKRHEQGTREMLGTNAVDVIA